MNSWLAVLVKLLIIQTVICENIRDSENSTLKTYLEDTEGSKILSRRKRFVIFPDGSSLQLGFYNQFQAFIPIGDIFIFAHTAALAWSLPAEPKYITMLKDYEKPLRRNDKVTKTINYLDERGRIIAKVPYKRRLIVNPAFAKRSIDDNELMYQEEHKEQEEKKKVKIDRKKLHEKQIENSNLKLRHLDKDAIEFHRSNRLDLYQKIETLITSGIQFKFKICVNNFQNLYRLGRNGKQCVLYNLCEAARQRRIQGTFLQELLNAVFTLPKGEQFHSEEYREYDDAHTLTDDCLARYPGCVDNNDSKLIK